MDRKKETMSLAEIRKQNMLMRGLITEEGLEERSRRGVLSDRAGQLEASKIPSTISVMRGKEEARQIMRNRWLKSRKTGGVHTLSDDFSQREAESNAFLESAAKANPSVIPSSEKDGREALRLTNEYRESKHLPPCSWDSEIFKVCVRHSQEMASGKKGFDHSCFRSRISSLPFPTIQSGENLFKTSYNNIIAHQAVDGWIHSPGHEKNLVGNYTHCGIGTAVSSSGEIFVTQIFVRK